MLKSQKVILSKKTNCPVCHKEEALYSKYYGVMPGAHCKARRMKQSKPNQPTEMTTAAIKQGRKEYAKSIIQPFRGGELSKEYVDIYGTKGINVKPEEVKKAKPLWKDTYSDNFNLKKSK